MLQCPDCDSIKMFSAEPEGDGKCSSCHGTGYGGLVEAFFESADVQPPVCDECQGTGKCQKCSGTGAVEDYVLTLAA